MSTLPSQPEHSQSRPSHGQDWAQESGHDPAEFSSLDSVFDDSPLHGAPTGGPGGSFDDRLVYGMDQNDAPSGDSGSHSPAPHNAGHASAGSGDDFGIERADLGLEKIEPADVAGPGLVATPQERKEIAEGLAAGADVAAAGAKKGAELAGEGAAAVAGLNPLVAFYQRKRRNDEADRARRIENDRKFNDKVDGQAKDAHNALASTRSPAQSDQFLDHGKPGLEFFERFAPLYTKWTGQPFDIGKTIHEPYNQFRGILLGEFRADAGRLKQVSQGCAESEAAVMRAMQGLAAGGWQGEAAGSAQTKSVEYGSVLKRLGRHCSSAATASDEVIAGVEKQLTTFVESVLKFASGDCAGKGPAEIDDMIAFARGEGKFADIGLLQKAGDFGPEYKSIMKAVVPHLGEPVSEMLPDWPAKQRISWLPGIGGPLEGFDQLDQLIGFQKMQNEVATWLNNHFVKVFEGACQDFHQTCTRTIEALTQTFTQLTTQFARHGHGFGQEGPR